MFRVYCLDSYTMQRISRIIRCHTPQRFAGIIQYRHRTNLQINKKLIASILNKKLIASSWNHPTTLRQP